MEHEGLQTMSIQPGVWGIDLGQCALKALRLENIDGQVTATAFDYVEHPKILSQPDADPDQLTREALEKFLERNDLAGDFIAISIPGQSGLARFVKLPPVEEKKITDIVRFEAKQQIPFNLEEVVWDYQKIGSGLVTDGFAMETEIGLFAIKRDTVNRYLQHFKDVNVEVHLVQMAPLALCNFVAHDLLNDGQGEARHCVVALDIGTDNSNLVITDAQRIIWQRPIPLGGNHFTRALTKDLKLTFAKAEHLKRNATKSPDLKKILAALKPVLNDFVGEVQRSLGYFMNTHRDATIEYMIGLGSAFRLPGLQKFLSEKLQLDVRKLASFNRLTGDSVITAPAFTENILSFAVAQGLALQALGISKLTTNLLPNEIRVDRLIRAKKPYAVTAAAALVFGTSVAMLGYATEFRAFATDRGPVKAAVEQANQVVKENNDWNSKCQAQESRITDAKTGVRSIIAGQEERVNWLELMKFIDEALPKPDGSNLLPVPRKYYYHDNDLARIANAIYQRNFTGSGKLPDVKISDDEQLSNLIQVNIEAVACRFMDNLSGFLNRVKQAGGDQDGIHPDDLKTPPTEGKGWVVEVRGYTYHHQGRRFISDTFVENLRRLRAKPDPSTEAAAAAPAEGGEKPTTPEDPVVGKVSHVVLFKHFRNPNPDSSLALAGQTVVPSLLTATASGGTGGPPGDMAAMMGMYGGGEGGATGSPDGGGGEGFGSFSASSGSSSRRSNWQPLSGGGGAGFYGGYGGGGGFGNAKFGSGLMGTGGPSGTMGTGPAGPPIGGPPPMAVGMGMTGGTAGRMGGLDTGAGVRPGGGFTTPMMRQGMGMGMGAAMMRPGSGTAMPGMPGMEGDPNFPPGSQPQQRGNLSRTEFIVLFLWREPTNSDKLLAVESEFATGFGEGGVPQ